MNTQSTTKMTVPEAMTFYGKAASTIRRRLRDGELKGEKIDGSWYVYPEPNHEQDDASQEVQLETEQTVSEGETEQLRSETQYLRDQVARRDQEIDQLTNLLMLSTEQQGVLLKKLLTRQE